MYAQQNDFRDGVAEMLALLLFLRGKTRGDGGSARDDDGTDSGGLTGSRE